MNSQSNFIWDYSNLCFTTPDIWIEILKFLKFEDLLQLRLGCQNFNWLVWKYGKDEVEIKIKFKPQIC